MRSRVLAITLGAVALAAALPLLTGSATMREEMFLILMVVTLASSVNIIMGYTGYVSFGHIVYFGLGGYIAFYLMQLQHVHFLVAMVAGGIMSSAIALLLGVPVLRLRGAYFALATIGINEATRTFINNFDPFGGSLGMFFNYEVYDMYGGASSAATLAYYAIVAVTLLTIATSYLIKTSKFGLGLMAIREDQDASKVFGIDPARAKVIVYALSAFFPGLAGPAFFFKNGIIEPGIAFDLLRSIEALVMVMLGGYGTVTGPIVGALIYDRLRAFLITSPTFSSLHLFIAGVLLLVIVLFVTAGFVGWFRQRSPTLRRYLA